MSLDLSVVRPGLSDPALSWERVPESSLLKNRELGWEDLGNLTKEPLKEQQLQEERRRKLEVPKGRSETRPHSSRGPPAS